jgi:hypothetical protein
MRMVENLQHLKIVNAQVFRSIREQLKTIKCQICGADLDFTIHHPDEENIGSNVLATAEAVHCKNQHTVTVRFDS